MPILTASGRLTDAAAVVSVSPQPSSTGIPAPRKKWPSRVPSGAPPEITHSTSPPSAAAELPEDENVERGTFQTQDQRDLPTFHRLAGLDCSCRRQREHLPLVLVDGLLLRGGVQPLEHKRDGEQQRGFEGGEILLQRTRTWAVADGYGGVYQRYLDVAREDVRERQEQQRTGVADEQRGQARDGARRAEQEIAVGERATLRPTGGARGVDDRGE